MPPKTVIHVITRLDHGGSAQNTMLTALGHGREPLVRHAAQGLLESRGPDGRWTMHYSYRGKVWCDVEGKGKPSKWVTLRARRVLKRIGVTV
jgi:hypothetical protein